jgi:two-component system NtrC family sensor kinase
MTDASGSPGGSHRQVAPADRDRLAELGQVAGDLVHELKNPIGVITLNAELLLKAATPGLSLDDRERLDKRVHRVLESARSLQSIVQSFLSFARPGRPDPDAVDLNDLLATILEEQSDLLEQARIHVSFHRDEALAMLPADIHHLRSIFLNVISNAREALLERPVVGTESTRKLLVITRAGTGTVRVVIANNGPPFAERVAAHLFEPFVSSKEEGTGLGLAIVRRLVELHQGTVTASSDPAQGVSFTLEFPTSLGPAKARTELPLPTVEAKVRSGTAKNQGAGRPLRTSQGSTQPARTRKRTSPRQLPESGSRKPDV